MIVALILAALVIVYAACALYLHKASKYLDNSDAVWDRLYLAAKNVIENPAMPDGAASFAAAAILCAGCGCLTRSFLLDTISRAFRLARTDSDSAPPFVLPKALRKEFSAVIVNAIYYDSLRAPFSGFLLRRFVAPWLQAAAEGQVANRRATVAQMVVTSRHAIEHRREGRRLLAYN